MTDEMNDAEDWQARAQSAEAALSRVQAEAEARLIRAELKAEALRAGMVDLDGLKLLDVADLRLTEVGDVADAPAVLARLKRAKPWLFGMAMSSSSAANPPRPEPPRTRHANDLSHEEWVAARAALLRRR
ncbi:hypothetical protein [Acidocella sp.]|uniref:hypothetical protein n=1 Tax=Acidocella sp. TaxID=50710 RepID=UPI0017FCC77D|nr:hypothetical protein [Acidocella sp.]NNM57720.1 hypothetical protein [Acidocella sp.]